MTPEKLKATIFEELNERDINSWHGITKDNVDQLLVEPTVIELVDVLGKKKRYWLVLDEKPNDIENGYRVIYDGAEEIFGLATKSTIKDKNIGFLVGLYGSFIDALNNM